MSRLSMYVVLVCFGAVSTLLRGIGVRLVCRLRDILSQPYLSAYQYRLVVVECNNTRAVLFLVLTMLE